VSDDGDISAPVSEVTNNSIIVYKKRGLAKLSSDNINKMLADKKVILESNLCAAECLKMMKDNINVADIVEIPVGKFIEKSNTVSKISGVIPAVRIPICNS